MRRNRENKIGEGLVFIGQENRSHTVWDAHINSRVTKKYRYPHRPRAGNVVPDSGVSLAELLF